MEVLDQRKILQTNPAEEMVMVRKYTLLQKKLKSNLSISLVPMDH